MGPLKEQLTERKIISADLVIMSRHQPQYHATAGHVGPRLICGLATAPAANRGGRRQYWWQTEATICLRPLPRPHFTFGPISGSVPILWFPDIGSSRHDILLFVPISDPILVRSAPISGGYRDIPVPCQTRYYEYLPDIGFSPDIGSDIGTISGHAGPGRLNVAVQPAVGGKTTLG